MNEALQKLRKLTEALPSIQDITKDAEVGCIKIATETDELLDVHGVLNRNEVAVVDFTMKAGMKVPAHIHKETEIFVVYCGECTIETPDNVFHVPTGAAFVIHPGVLHYVSTVFGCKILAITVPASEGYPNARA